MTQLKKGGKLEGHCGLLWIIEADDELVFFSLQRKDHDPSSSTALQWTNQVSRLVGAIWQRRRKVRIWHQGRSES